MQGHSVWNVWQNSHQSPTGQLAEGAAIAAAQGGLAEWNWGLQWLPPRLP